MRRAVALTAFLVVLATPLMAGGAYKDGLVAHYFKDIDEWGGVWTGEEGPNIDATPYTFKEYAYSREEPLVNHQFIKRGWFSIRWVGYIEVPPGHNAGDDAVSVTFEMWMDDGARLYIDGDQIIGDWKPRWEKHRSSHRFGTLSLSPGHHRIIIEYFQGQSLQKDDKDPAKLYWTIPELGIKSQIVPASHFFHKNSDLKDYVPN
jgi:hypothetical protein